MSDPDFHALLAKIPPDLHAEASREALDDQGPPDPASLLVYDLLLAHLEVANQVPDVAAENRVIALSLLLCRELAAHPQGQDPRVLTQVQEMLAQISKAPRETRETILRQIASGRG